MAIRAMLMIPATIAKLVRPGPEYCFCRAVAALRFYFRAGPWPGPLSTTWYSHGFTLNESCDGAWLSCSVACVENTL